MTRPPEWFEPKPLCIKVAITLVASATVSCNQFDFGIWRPGEPSQAFVRRVGQTRGSELCGTLGSDHERVGKSAIYRSDMGRSCGLRPRTCKSSSLVTTSAIATKNDCNVAVTPSGCNQLEDPNPIEPSPTDPRCPAGDRPSHRRSHRRTSRVRVRRTMCLGRCRQRQLLNSTLADRQCRFAVR